MTTTNVPAPCMSPHAIRQTKAKGWTIRQVWEAFSNPDVTYPSLKYPGQERRIKGDLCVIVEPSENRVVTVYKNMEETALRPDQIARGERIRR